jgi:hypothetical protein
MALIPVACDRYDRWMSGFQLDFLLRRPIGMPANANDTDQGPIETHGDI